MALQTEDDGSREVIYPARKRPRSVLQDWVMQLPLRQQGVLILALRGPDGAVKESATKPIVRSLRACVMVSGREGSPMEVGQKFDDDSFMRMDLVTWRTEWAEVCKCFHNSMDAMNLHCWQHLIHAALIAGQHPDKEVAYNWTYFYRTTVHKLHLYPETLDQMRYRLRDGKREDFDE